MPVAILHTVPGIANEASGPSYSVRRLCETLITHGRDVTLATLEQTPSISGLPFLKTFPPGAGPARLGRSPAMKRWMLESAGAGRFGLIHNHSLWMMPNVYPGHAARVHGLPFVVSPRGTFSKYAFASGSVAKRFFWPWIQKPSMSAVTCFHATAEAECADIRRMGFEQPIAVIPNGIDVPPGGTARRGDVRTLLYVGRLHKEKGLELLLNAWRVVSPRHPEWQLKLVGPDIAGYRSHLEGLAARLALRRVVFAGPLFGDDKQQAYADAALFVLPSPSENFGVAVAEALAAGTPAIVTRGAPWQGLVRERAGWWPAADLDAFAEAMDQALASTPDELAVAGARGREWMIREFSWTSVARRMEQCYDWLLDGGRAPAFVNQA